MCHVDNVCYNYERFSLINYGIFVYILNDVLQFYILKIVNN